MTWVKLDDLWIQSPEMVAAGDKAVLLALWCLSWSALNLTDGWVTDDVIRGCAYVHHRATRGRATTTLSEIGFWTRGEGGYQILQWERFLQKAAEVKEKRAASAERQRRWYERQKAKRNADPNAVRKRAPNAPPDPDPEPRKGVRGREEDAPSALDSAESSVSPPLGADLKCDQCGQTLAPTEGVPTEDAADWTWRDEDKTVRWCNDCWTKDTERNGSGGSGQVAEATYASGVCHECGRDDLGVCLLFGSKAAPRLNRHPGENAFMTVCADCLQKITSHADHHGEPNIDFGGAA